MSFIMKIIEFFFGKRKTTTTTQKKDINKMVNSGGIISSIIFLIKSCIDYKSSKNNKEYADVVKETDTDLRIQKNNKDIEEGNVTDLATKLHEFSTLVDSDTKEGD